jgi:hypothetical protein
MAAEAGRLQEGPDVVGKGQTALGGRGRKLAHINRRRRKRQAAARQPGQDHYRYFHNV